MVSGGQIWGWVAGLPYATLVALQVAGQEAWRVAATPYLDIAIVVGLTAIGWRLNAPADPGAWRRRARAAIAAVKANASVRRQAEEQGLLSDEPPDDDGGDPIVARGSGRQSLGGLAARVLLTLLFVTVLFILLVAIGLGIVRWAKAWWYIVVPAMALVAGLLTWWIRGMLREGEAAQKESAVAKR